MFGLSKRSKQSVPKVTKQWSAALPGEVGFWQKWLESEGYIWKDDFARRVDPNYPLQPHIRPYIIVPPGSQTIRILDVGAGLLTVLGKKWDGYTLDITAVDPLADEYDRVLAAAGMNPIVRTIKGDAEHIASQFPESRFDFVYAQNCIDHCLNPMLAIEQMLTLVKPGHYLMLEHAVNEGETMKYDGLHQWNFCIKDGHFTIWRPGWKADAQAAFEARADIEARIKDNWLVVAMKKR
jgi:SAM-dependent methyltransferase